MRPPRTWTRLADLGPGVYVDGRGGLHVLCDEFLAGSGLVVTADTRAALEAAIKAAVLERLPGDVAAYLQDNNDGQDVRLHFRMIREAKP